MPPLMSYSLLVGSSNSRGYFRRADDRRLRKITARHFPEGFTILSAQGSWYDPDTHTFRKEEAREIVLCTDRRTALKAWCEEIGTALRQKELLLTEGGRTRRFRFEMRASAKGRSSKRRASS